MRLWTKRPNKTQIYHVSVLGFYLPALTLLVSFIHSFIMKKLRSLWQNQEPLHNKLLPITPTPVPWSSSNLHSRKLEIVLTRLWIAHTRLTHSYLVLHFFPLICDDCGTDNSLTVTHLFSCPHLTALRNSYHVPHNYVQVLANDPVIISNVFPFLHDANLICRIYSYPSSF